MSTKLAAILPITVLTVFMTTGAAFAVKTSSVSQGTGAAMCGKHGGLKPTSSGATYCDYQVGGKVYDITCSGTKCSIIILARPQQRPGGGKLPPGNLHPVSAAGPTNSSTPVKMPLAVGEQGRMNRGSSRH